MNLVDAVVTKVLNKPYFEYDVWWIPVEYNSWGVLGYCNIMCKEAHEAFKVAVGYKFQC